MTQWRVLVPIGIALALWAIIVARPSVSSDFLPSRTTSKPCRPTAAERAATEVAITSYSPDVPTPTTVPHPVVTTELAILGGEQDIPLLLPSLVIRAPVAQLPELKALLELSPAEGGVRDLIVSSAYRSQLVEALANSDDSNDFGVLEDASRRINSVLAIDEPPIVNIAENGTLTVVIPQPAQLLADPIVRADQGAGTERLFVSAGLDGASGRDGLIVAGGWTITSSGQEIRAQFDGKVDTRTAWDVRVCTAGLPIDRAYLLGTPTPEIATPRTAPWKAPATPADPIHLSQSTSGVHWIFPPTAQPATAVVVARAPLLTALRIWSLTDSTRYLGFILAFMIPAALLLGSLLLIPRVSSPRAEFEAARARMVSGAWAVARLTIAAVFTVMNVSGSFVSIDRLRRDQPAAFVGAFAIAIVVIGLLGFSRPEAESGLRSMNDLALGLITAVAIGWCMVFVGTGSVLPSFRLAPLTFPAIMVAGNSMFLAAAVTVWRQRNEVGTARQSIMMLPAVGALSLLYCIVVRWAIYTSPLGSTEWWWFVEPLIIPLWSVVCLVVGLALLIVSLWPSDLKRTIGNQPIGRFGRSAFGVIVAVVSLVILMQWVWAAHSGLSLWYRNAVEANVLSRESLDFVFQEVLGWKLPFFPLSIFGAGLEFALILGLAGIFGVLAAAGRDARTPFLRVDQRWIRRLLAVIFAAFVISYGGGILGLQAPFAFVIGLVLLRLAWSDRIVLASALIDEQSDAAGEDHPLIVTRRHALLHRAIALADLERKQAIARRALDDGTLQAEDYLQTLGELAARKSGPHLGRPEAAGAPSSDSNQSSATFQRSPLAPSHRNEPSDLVLAVGPRRSWWDNGVMAVHLGAVLAVAPIAYFMFVFLSSRGGVEWSLNAPFAITGFAAALLYEMAFWLVAALIFGCLFPYLYGSNGAVKGAVLGAVYVGANALAALIGVPGNALWQVRAFQLVLFLMLLGTWLNLKTVEAYGLRWRDLLALYDLPNRASIVSNVLPLVTALAAVVLQLLLGQTQAATENLVSGDAARAILTFFGGQ